MSLKIATEKEFSDGLKEKIKEHCRESLDLLQNQAETDPHEVVHEVRKAFKKIRGCLRLIRDQTDFYKEENAFFRDEGRRISDIRDATSVIEIFDDVYDRYSDQLYQKTFHKYREHLFSKREEMAKDVLKDRGVLKTIEKQLTDKCEDIDQWKIDIQTFEEISPSVERVYQRGRKGYQKAVETESTADFHEWRKRVKYLRYQLDLLNRIWPDFMEAWEDELHDLSDLLGDDHDLYMLGTLVEQEKDRFADRESFELVKSLISFRRSKLQAEALSLGKRLYFLDKETFVSLLGTAWEEFRSE